MQRLQLARAARVLRAGGVVAYPTEAVYGLGCDPLDEAAVHRILALKHRPVSKGLILIAADRAQLDPYLKAIFPRQRARLSATWPGPVTWSIPAREDVPAWLRGDHSTLAVRVTAHPGAAALCRAFGGAIVSTSANLSGRPPLRHAGAVRRALGDGIDLVVHGPLGGLRRPTEVRDLRTGRILRRG